MAWAKTKQGYNSFQLLSALQKDIRRGNEEQAFFWAAELEKYDYNMLWNRLTIIASEDIGVANPIVPVIIETLRKHYEEALGVNPLRRKAKHDSYRVFLVNAPSVFSLMTNQSSSSPKCSNAHPNAFPKPSNLHH